MLRLSKLTDYATVILSYMAKDGISVHGALEIAEATGIAQPTVSKLLKILLKAKILMSVRGAKGGYLLAKQPDKITMAAVITAVEGAMGLTECAVSNKTCDQAQGCQIQGNWHSLNQRIWLTLESVTLADMITPCVKPQEVFIPVSRLFR